MGACFSSDAQQPTTKGRSHSKQKDGNAMEQVFKDCSRLRWNILLAFRVDQEGSDPEAAPRHQN